MSNSLDGLPLPDGLIWEDEFKSSKIAQSQSRSLTGALIVQSGVKIGGRPMTLSGQDSAWISYQDLLNLRDYLDLNPDTEMTLNYRGGTYTVIMNGTEGQALTAEPVVSYDTPVSGDWYTITLKLMTAFGV